VLELKAIVYEGPQTVNVQEREMPAVKEGWALIKASHAGICGTDLIIYGGTHPRAAAPLIPGHEFSGTIVSGHPTLQPGTPVTVNPLLSCGTCPPCLSGQAHVCETLQLVGIDCDGGMGEYVQAPIDKIIPLPEGVSLKLGALMEPIAVGVHAVRQAGFVPGDEALVYGAGTIGLCVALSLKNLGARRVVIVETNPDRIKKAEELGFTAIHSLTQDVKEVVLAETNGSGFDFVFDCAGHPAVATQVTEVVKVRGTVVIVASYKNPAALQLQQGMFKELSIRFVRVYTHKDFEIAAELVAKEPNFEKIITHVLPPEEAQKGFKLLTTPSDAVKVMYHFE
jgi:(R,R)-butanediol dehydrogenase / meso-butanediol dehydrogenase / diacetyl reductase